MIITFLLSVLVTILSILFYIFPVVTVADIPLAGEAMSSALYTAMGYWNSAMETVPYFYVAWDIFLFVIIPFEISLLVLKFFLGHRTPIHE